MRSLRNIVLGCVVLAASAAWAVGPTIAFPGAAPAALSDATLAALPRQKVTATLHGHSASYEGYDLRAVLKAAGFPEIEGLRGKALAAIVTVTGADGYRAVFALSELDPTIADRQVLLVDREDAKPLPVKDGPWRLVVPADARPARWVRQLTSISVSSP